MLLRSLFILLFSLLVVYSCDAPRLNPLDPENPDYVPPKVDTVVTEPTYSIEGTIKTFAPPFSAVAGVKVYWPNEYKIVQTDQNGNFIIDNLKNEDGWLYIEKDGYFQDSASVAWASDTSVVRDFVLKYIPTAAKFSVFTEVEYSYRPTIFRMGFDIEIVDNDGIVDSVFISNDELGIFKNIRGQFSTFYQEFNISTLGLTSIDAAVGKEFSLVFKDNENPNNRIIAAKNKISRIIKESNDPDGPINGATISDTTTFTWKRVDRGYKYHFLFEIYTDETNGGNIVFNDNDISSDKLSYTITEVTNVIDNSQTGTDNYYWVVWCIDEYNNKVRSKQGTFTVQ